MKLPFRRRTTTRLIFALLLAIASAGSSISAGASQATIRAVESVGFTVDDLDRSVAFFRDVLTFEKLDERELYGDDFERLQGVFGARARVARLKLGDEVIELTDYLAPEGRPVPVDARSNDRWFQHIAIVVSDMNAAYERLRRHNIRHASAGPQRLPDWNPNAGGISAFYFKDPDGHVLEVIHFPAGKGDPRWHRPTDRLFLGIDHTAIVVADTAESLRLYRDNLGLRIAGESENYGIEQERLNNVFGARLRITALRAAAGPGIEFLEYLAPSTGRETPRDLGSNDLAHWQTRLTTTDAEAAVHGAVTAGGTRVSPGAVALHADAGASRGAIVRDRDGHALLFVDTATARGTAQAKP